MFGSDRWKLCVAIERTSMNMCLDILAHFDGDGDDVFRPNKETYLQTLSPK